MKKAKTEERPSDSHSLILGGLKDSTQWTGGKERGVVVSRLHTGKRGGKRKTTTRDGTNLRYGSFFAGERQSITD